MRTKGVSATSISKRGYSSANFSKGTALALRFDAHDVYSFRNTLSPEKDSA